jgi:hypothetical protein
VVEAASQASSALPVTSLYSAATVPALKSAMGSSAAPNGEVEPGKTVGGKTVGGKTVGGNADTGILPYTLVGTVLLVLASGCYTNFNKRSSKDDTPPKP